MRLIDAENFLEALENADADVCETYSDFYCDWGFSQKAIEDLLLNIPTIEAKPVVHGAWVWDVETHGDPMYGVDEDFGYRCSECKVWADEYGVDGDIYEEPPTHILHFCPNCGADMRERNMIIEINPDFAELVAANDGYCPCAIERSEDTRCMCKEFREQTEGECHCGRYRKVKA